MRFQAIVLIAWTAIATSLESNVTKFNNEKIAQSHLENVEAKNLEKVDVKDHSDRNVNTELSTSDVDADKRESNDAFTSDSSPSVSIYSTPFTETIVDDTFVNYESGHTIPEDVLLENAGSFGQKVWQGRSGVKPIVKSTETDANSRLSDRHTNFRKSFNSSAPLESKDDREESYVSITHEPFVYAQREENVSDDLSSDNPKTIEDSSAKNFYGYFDVRSLTEGHNSPLGKTNVTPFFENVSESFLFTSQAGLSGTYHDVADKIAKKSAKPVEKSESVDRTPTSVEVSPSLQVRKFSAPIVVPDLPREDLPQDVIDYSDDNDASRAFKSVENAEFISKVDTEPSKAATASNSITTSSIMLNPLQVGITLMNADESGLIDNDEPQSAAINTNNLQRIAIINEEFDNRNRSRVDCKNENFQCDEEDKSVGVVTQRVPDNSVEIQKSIELYYSAPVHEIHYPAEYIQSSNFDIKTNNDLQRSKQQYDQGNHQVDRNIVKTNAFELPQKHNRHEYNALEDNAGKTMASALIAESSVHEQAPRETLDSQSFRYNSVQPAKPHISSTNREQLQLTNSFRSPEVNKRPETSQLLLKIIPEGSSVNGGFLVPIPQPYGIEKIVEKTVRVPHPIEIEKVIEKKVPIPGQIPVAVSQPYHMRVQVPVDHIVEKQIRGPHLYPIYIEKRLPYLVRRLQSPAYPQHIKPPATTYSIEKSPSHVPIEKVTEKPAAFSLPSRLPYRANADRPIDSNGAIETKFNKYRHKLRESVFAGENVNTHDNNAAGGFTFEPHQSETNTSQIYSDIYSGPFSVHGYDKSYAPTGHLNTVKLMILPKKYDHVVLRPHVIAPSYAAVPVSLKRQIVYNLVEKDKAAIKDAATRKATQDKTKFSPPFPGSTTQVSTMTATLRRGSRQPEAQYTGNFRQSKMEYGFKPPMIPSVQYDEKTGSKVEN